MSVSWWHQMPSSFFSCGRDWQVESSGLACSHLMWLLKASALGGFGPSGVYLASHRCFLRAGSCLETERSSFSPLYTRAEVSCEGTVAAGGAPLERCPVSSLPGFLSVCASLLSIACWWLLSQGVAAGAECGPVAEEHRPRHSCGQAWPPRCCVLWSFWSVLSLLPVYLPLGSPVLKSLRALSRACCGPLVVLSCEASDWS